jgi:hypothetical protein
LVLAARRYIPEDGTSTVTGADGKEYPAKRPKVHRTAGGDPKHQPGNWLRMKQTQELAAEIDGGSIPQIRGIESKQQFGTFVAKELVYAYAMWNSEA